MKLYSLITGIYLVFAATAYAADPPIPGQEYTLINPPVPTETGKKIEVVEAFWYACPHCYHFEPSLNDWVKKLPKDAEFRPVPAVLNQNWTPLTKMFYALEALGQLTRLHEQVYAAIHEQHLDLSDETVMAEWAGQHGVDKKKFADTYNSFAVQSKLQRSIQLMKAYGVTGTPSVIIDGKYLTSPSMAGSYEREVEVLDQLVAKARQERAGKK